MDKLKVYTAKAIYTMNPSLPKASAVAVRDDRIIEVGTLDTLRPWLDAYPHEIDRRFEKHTILPGLIDPHLHPSMAAVILSTHLITAFEWRLPNRHVQAVHGRENYMRRLREIEEETAQLGEPLISWGYHHLWHGRITRQDLNSVSSSRPIVLWERGFHEVIVNDAAVEWMNLSEEIMERHPQIDAGTGRMFENGMFLAMQAMKPFLYREDRLRAGLQDTGRAVHLGGQTTICDMVFPMNDFDNEWTSYKEAYENPETPFRMQLVSAGKPNDASTFNVADCVARVEDYRSHSSHRLFFQKAVKLFTDGGFFSGLSQILPPGYIQAGREGEWMVAPDMFEQIARGFWNAGYRIHVHCCGDMGVELALDVLEKLQWERPRFNHRFTIEHFGLSTPEHPRRIRDLGANVSCNIYYLRELGYAYFKNALGHERASSISRVGSLMREGVTTTFHSDFTMAPCQPLNSAWVAINRIGESGEVLGPEERVTVEQAMRAITIDAAYIIGMEDEVGSIRAGKKADFTVLAEDPYLIDPLEIKDIPIWGTVFEGKPFSLAD